MIEIGLAGYGVFESGRENREIETDEWERGVEDLNQTTGCQRVDMEFIY